MTTAANAAPSSSKPNNRRGGKPGKSRYASKVAAPAVRKAVVPPTNIYLSTCCKVQATKSRAVTKETDQLSVGKWRCGSCGKRTPVTVSKFKDVELAPEVTGVA